MGTALKIPKLKFSEPRNNLPGRKGVVTVEDRFTIAFSRVYISTFMDIHRGSSRNSIVLAREIPVNGYGIADALAVAWKDNDLRYIDTRSFAGQANPCCRAFECKMKDWRKALSQAARYRYFAHQAIAVMPVDTCRRALPFLETFKKVKVGLWSFDVRSGKIQVHHTPRSKTPKSERYYIHSIDKVKEATKRALPIL